MLACFRLQNDFFPFALIVLHLNHLPSRPAEKHLSEAVKVAGHPLQVLQIVANTSPNPSPAEAAVRQASAVHFKNVVKKGWDTNQEVRKI